MEVGLFDKNSMKFDQAFMVFLMMFLLASSLIFASVVYQLNYQYQFQKQAGEFLAFKDNVAIIGTYAPTIMSYKILNEQKFSGDYNDFGIVWAPGNTSEAAIQELVDNYHTDKVEVMGNEEVSNIFFWNRIT